MVYFFWTVEQSTSDMHTVCQFTNLKQFTVLYCMYTQAQLSLVYIQSVSRCVEGVRSSNWKYCQLYVIVM